jgi:hypothetical protein
VQRSGPGLLVTIVATLHLQAASSLQDANPTPTAPMRRKTTAYSIVAAMCLLQLGLAMVAAPFGCEWGLATYAWVGVLGLLGLMVMPYFLRRTFKRHVRMPSALGFAALFVFTWLTGWFVGFANSGCAL